MATLELTDRVLKEMDKGHTPIAIFLDLSKAFDTIDHKILLDKLHYYGIRDNSLKLFESYLDNRTQYVCIDNISSSTSPIHNGVPQGSILGPLLFLIYVNDMAVSSKLFNFIMYADDTTLLSTLRINTFDLTIINKELEEIFRWLTANKLSLNVRKTKYMIFHNRQKKLPALLNYDIKINDTPIARVSSFDFLGLSLNENMSWKTHCDKIGNKIAKYMGVFNRLKRQIPSHILKTLISTYP